MKKTTKTTTKKVTKKASFVAKDIDTKKSKSPYSDKEKKDMHELVEKIISAPANVTPEELRGMVLVAWENPKSKEVKVLGGIRNISPANVLKIVLESLKMSPMDGAILMAMLAKKK